MFFKRFSFLSKISLLATAVVLSLSSISVAQQDYYFSETVTFSDDIPSPEEFLGYPIGSHFTRHDRLVDYFQELARISDKAHFQVIGETYEHRPQVVLTVTAPENFEQIEEIQEKQLSVLDPENGSALDPESDKSVVALNYSVHGDETSSGEAAMLTAYYLIAGEGEEVQRYLDESVVHIDPAQNPDGRDRAANWHNNFKSFPPVADPADREHVQAWPRGRTNHFWHDLNRDWFAVTQQESKNRLEFYHQWYPHVQIDFHEMGTNSGYYLEPTKPERTWNPIVPEYQYEVLNPLLAQYQREALDEIGALYWSNEVFDNISPIYGSTYPDIQGGVGSTFEVGSSRGIVQESTSGPVTFKSTIRRHLRTGIATVRAAVEEKETLFEYQRNFFTSAIEEGESQPVGAYIFGDEEDESLTNKFLNLLLTHRLEVYELNENLEQDGKQFRQGSSYVVPTDQTGYRLIHDIFESNTSFPDSVFYDITAWSLVQGYGINYAEVESGDFEDRLGDVVAEVPEQAGTVEGGTSNYAYLLSWADYNAPAALNTLLQKDVLAKVAHKPFTAQVIGGAKEFSYGSIVVPVAQQQVDPDSLYRLVEQAAGQHKVDFYSVGTGFNERGIDLGSRNIRSVEKPQTAMVIGDGVRSYEAGETWFLLNQQLGLGVSKLDKKTLSRVSLDRYNSLVLVDGRYNDWDKETVDKIRDWVHRGGTLIAYESAAEWAVSQKLVREDLIKQNEDPSGEALRYNYEEQGDRRRANTIPGVILEADIDPSNPIAFGASDRRQLFIKDGNTLFKQSENPYSTVAQYASNPLRGGFVNDTNLEKIRNTAAIIAKEEGSGNVILFADNPNFRSYWHTTSRLFLNAILFGPNLNL